VTDIHDIYMLTAVKGRQPTSKTGSVTIIHTWAISYVVKYSLLHMSYHPHMDTRLKQWVYICQQNSGKQKIQSIVSIMNTL